MEDFKMFELLSKGCIAAAFILLVAAIVLGNSQFEAEASCCFFLFLCFLSIGCGLVIGEHLSEK